MYLFFVLVSFITLTLLVTGLIRPQLVRMQSRKMVTLLLGGALVAFMLLTPTQAPDTSNAAPYRLVKSDDTSIAGRKRFRVFIISSLQKHSIEAKAQTAMKAAIDYSQKYGVDAISVFLVDKAEDAGTGMNLAVVRYAPDSGGFSGSQRWRWKVMVTHEGNWINYFEE